MEYMWPVHLWNHWSIEILVLLSLALQLVLFLLAWIRRQREAYPLLRLFLWLAYLLADTTAIYVLGHLSSSCTAHEHRLIALWAAFLIMHLGGPDSITAYALEDNQLWLRHLLTLFVQVLGAAYVVYKNIVGSGTLIMVATFLTSVVGVVKFGERTCSLKYGILDNIPKLPHIKYSPPPGATINEKFLARLAHSLFDICQRVIADSPVDKTRGQLDDIVAFQHLPREYQYMVMGMELSLMYDILYTKATVIHGWPGGFCIRVASPLATVASLVLFHCSSKEVHSRIDVAVTYSLLAGALLLDTASLLSLLGSTWFMCATRWTWLRGVVVSHHWVAMMVGNGSCRLSRSWSGTMGQYNMLHLCARRDFNPLLGRLAKWMQIKERWEKKHYSGSIQIPEKVRESVLKQIDGTIMRGGLNTLGIIMSKWGENTLSTYRLERNSDLRSSLGTEFQEGIIIWHVGTELFLAESTIAAQANAPDDVKSQVEAVRAMSNYMVFLLVKRPYMLPGLAQNRLYQQTSDSLVKVQEGIATTTSGAGGWLQCTTMLKELFRLHDDPSKLEQAQSLATWLLNRPMPPNTIDNSHLVSAIKLANVLLREEASGTSSLELVLGMWSDFLVHAANRCSRESHAKKLNSGGEFTTLIWLLTEHFNRLGDRYG